MQDMIMVNMADYKLSRGKQKLITRDLGSCVAVAMRDAERGIGGLLHIMLPACPNPREIEEKEYPKFADTGIDLLIHQLVLAGAARARLTVKLAGAAHVIKTPFVPIEKDISSRNLEAVKNKLAQCQIPVLAMEVEEDFPRTVIFEPESGILQIKTAGKNDRFI